MIYLIISIASILLIIIICFVAKRKRSATPDVGKIYKTTDGYFNSNKRNKKPRRIIVVHQRDDKAVAVTKIYSKKEKKGNAYINGLVLKPKNHPSLTEDSIVSNSLIYGKNIPNQKQKHKIFPTDLESTNDKLTAKEYQIVKTKINADTKKHKKARDKTLSRWKNHFRN